MNNVGFQNQGKPYLKKIFKTFPIMIFILSVIYCLFLRLNVFKNK